MQPGSVVETVNPMRYIAEDQYTAIWQKLFAGMLSGFWGRATFVVFVLLAIFFGIRRRNPKAAIAFSALAVLVAYGAGVLNMLKMLGL